MMRGCEYRIFNLKKNRCKFLLVPNKRVFRIPVNYVIGNDKGKHCYIVYYRFLKRTGQPCGANLIKSQADLVRGSVFSVNNL